MTAADTIRAALGRTFATRKALRMERAAITAKALHWRHERMALLDALLEACLHQGLPLDSTPESIAKHFRLNRELRERLEAYVKAKES